MIKYFKILILLIGFISFSMMQSMDDIMTSKGLKTTLSRVKKLRVAEFRSGNDMFTRSPYAYTYDNKNCCWSTEVSNMKTHEKRIEKCYLVPKDSTYADYNQDPLSHDKAMKEEDYTEGWFELHPWTTPKGQPTSYSDTNIIEKKCLARWVLIGGLSLGFLYHGITKNFFHV